MNLIKNLFNKKKLKVESEEVTWRRDKTIPDQAFYPSSNGPQGRPSNDNRINGPSSKQIEDYDFHVPEQNKGSSINQPAWMASNPRVNNSEPPSKYVDFGPPLGAPVMEKKSSRGILRTPIDFEASPQIAKYSNSNTNNYEEMNINPLSEPNFGPLGDSGKFGGRGNGLTRDQEFRRYRGNSAYKRRNQFENPRLKEYYDLENRINRMMVLNNQESEAKTLTKPIDIFEKPNNQFDNPENMFKELPGSRRVNAQVNSKPDIFGEVKAQPNLTKRRLKIFEGQTNTSEIDSTNPSGVYSKPDAPLTQRSQLPQSKRNQSSTLFEDMEYDGKDFEELMKIHHDRSMELRALEDRLISHHNDPRNITHLEQSLQEITTKIESLKPKNMYAEGEKRLLTEDINKKQMALQAAERQHDPISSMSTMELNAKEGVIREIEKTQGKIAHCRAEIDKFKISAEEKKKKWQELSEKNMNYELESMKMNLSNYDEELVRELKYFLSKYS